MVKQINTIYDVLENIDVLKNRIITNYAGEIIVYSEDDTRPDETYSFNSNLFYTLREMDCLRYLNCTVSHRSVSNYKLSLDTENIPRYRDFLEKVIKNSYNTRVNSVKSLIMFLNGLNFPSHTSTVATGYSYWGGASTAKCVTTHLGGTADFNITYCTASNVKVKNFLFRFAIRKCCILFTGQAYPTLNDNKYTIKGTDNSYFKTNKKLWNEDYKILSEKVLAELGAL